MFQLVALLILRANMREVCQIRLFIACIKLFKACMWPDADGRQVPTPPLGIFSVTPKQFSISGKVKFFVGQYLQPSWYP